MVKRKKEVGACGNYCAGCVDFRVLAENDNELRKDLAAKLTKELNRKISPDQVGCEGCWGDIHNDLVASIGCKIRQCVDSKAFATCAECDEFPCNIFTNQFTVDSEYANNIRDIQKDGLEEWINNKKNKPQKD